LDDIYNKVCIFLHRSVICQVRVIFAAEHPPEGLFGTISLSEGDTQHARELIGDLNIKQVCFRVFWHLHIFNCPNRMEARYQKNLTDDLTKFCTCIRLKCIGPI